MTLYATREGIETAFASAFDEGSDEMIDDLLYQYFSKLTCASFEVPGVSQCIDSWALLDSVLRMIEPTDVFGTGGTAIRSDSAIGELIHGLIGLGECLAETRMANLFGVSRAVMGVVAGSIPSGLEPADTFEERALRFARLLAHEAREDEVRV
ncbi:hypothetical protein PPMP20_26600 [Paraburkholderia phymatum]|uniref:Uncharacterized protein n=1 Tax=Paraburkholderia phymatum (strain DSM 17167 / CIP 108236 / LMG 21445 / STM815) TaxID=391038 RepID=B2JL41_PARP8|nr:hypothetical protein [Paraburkholderia phymatum]ACC72570.1 hypothetical protein Bphy_3416 [Paraburkholderia phymatum STM815]